MLIPRQSNPHISFKRSFDEKNILNIVLENTHAYYVNFLTCALW